MLGWVSPLDLQDCPARVSDKSVLQECPAGIVPYESDFQECRTRVSHKRVPQECPTRVSYKRVLQVFHKGVLQECPARVFHKSVQQRVLHMWWRSSPSDARGQQEKKEIGRILQLNGHLPTVVAFGFVGSVLFFPTITMVVFKTGVKTSVLRTFNGCYYYHYHYH